MPWIQRKFPDVRNRKNNPPIGWNGEVALRIHDEYFEIFTSIIKQDLCCRGNLDRPSPAAAPYTATQSSSTRPDPS